MHACCPANGPAPSLPGGRAAPPLPPAPEGGHAPLDVTISFSCTTFLWFKTLRILISRIAVTGNCGHRSRVRAFTPAPALPLPPTPKSEWAPSAAHPFLLVVHAHPLQGHDLPRRLIPSLVHLPAQVRVRVTLCDQGHTLLAFLRALRTRTSPPPPAPPSRRPRRCETPPGCRPCPPPAYPVHYSAPAPFRR